MKSHGIKAFDTLLFDMDQATISIYIDEVNMHHKLRLRDDPRIDSLVFFEEQLTVVAHLKPTVVKGSEKQQKGSGPEKQLERFKNIKSLDEFEREFAPEEFLIFRIFDKIKVRVETTTEFPLDIKCTLLFTKEDLEEYDKLGKEQEAQVV